MIVFALTAAAGWSENVERRVVRGYERHRPLDESEVRAIPLFVGYAAAATAFVRYRERIIRQRPVVAEGSWLAPMRLADEAWRRHRSSGFDLDSGPPGVPR